MHNLSFTHSVNRGKLIIVSKAGSLIVQNLEKAFHFQLTIKKNS